MNQNYTASSEKISLVGVGIALVSSVLYAAYILINKKQALNIDIYFSTFILCLINAVYFFILSHIDGSFGWPGTFRLWGVVFLIGFIATSAPILLMLKGLRTVGADMAALLSVLEPVFTVILGFLFLEEKLHSIQYLGIMVVLLGAMVAAYSNLVRTT